MSGMEHEQLPKALCMACRDGAGSPVHEREDGPGGMPKMPWEGDPFWQIQWEQLQPSLLRKLGSGSFGQVTLDASELPNQSVATALAMSVCAAHTCGHVTKQSVRVVLCAQNDRDKPAGTTAGHVACRIASDQVAFR